jgi:hypothetical protein
MEDGGLRMAMATFHFPSTILHIRLKKGETFRRCFRSNGWKDM